MAKFNISQAAKLYGKDRSSIQRKIKQGKISVSTNSKGHKEIDLTELIRVFGEPPNNNTAEAHEANGNSQQSDTVNATPFLQEKVSMLEGQVEALQQDKEWLQTKLEWLQAKLDQMTVALPDYTQQKGFWSRLFSRS